jgi:hypothetical protein
VKEIKRFVAPHLLANPDAAGALHAEIIIAKEKGARFFKLRDARLERYRGRLDVVYNLLKLTAQVLGTGETVAGVFPNDTFQDAAPKFLHPRRFGAYDHAGCDGGIAGARKAPHPLDLDDAKTARAGGGEEGVVAERGNVDAGGLGRLEHGLSRAGLNRPAVDDDIHCLFGTNRHDLHPQIKQ